jgi:uncharacterized membrane protein YgcG
MRGLVYRNTHPHRSRIAPIPNTIKTKSKMKIQAIILSFILCSVAGENVLRGSKENNSPGSRLLKKKSSKESTKSGMSSGGGSSSGMSSGGMMSSYVSVSSSLPL